MPSFQLHQGFSGHSIRNNPWQPTQFILTAAEHFGVIGSGKVYIITTPQGFGPATPVSCLATWGTSDSAFDACFSEVDPNLVAVACGDGVKLYNLQSCANVDGAAPVSHNMEHSGEVSCVTWGGSREYFFSAGWDRTIKMFSAAKPQASVFTMGEHLKEVYELSCSNRSPTSLLSCSGDGTWKLWDTRSPQRSVMSQVGHQHQFILSIDFNKHDPVLFATGGVDRTIRLWDMRRSTQPLVALPGHDQACRRVRFSPHSRTLLASSGYDFRVCSWDLQQPQRPLTGRYQQHREFVVGVEWSMSTPNGLASTSFDGRAFFWTTGQTPTLSPPQQLPRAAPPPRVCRPRTANLPGLPPAAPPLPPLSAPR